MQQTCGNDRAFTSQYLLLQQGKYVNMLGYCAAVGMLSHLCRIIEDGLKDANVMIFI